MIENDYQLAWGMYAVSALGCMLAWFYFTGWMWRYLREPLRLLAAVALFTPTLVNPASGLYAPALAITAMDLLFKDSDYLWRSVADLMMYGAFVFAVYALFVLVRVLLKSKRQAAEQQTQGSTEADRGDADESESGLSFQQELQQDAADPNFGLSAQR